MYMYTIILVTHEGCAVGLSNANIVDFSVCCCMHALYMHIMIIVVSTRTCTCMLNVLYL